MKTIKKEYVAGFLFDPDTQKVALVTKAKPQWQAGKLNGIGGKIEPNEDPETAMVREFLEETGALVEGWRLFCDLRGNDWRVFMYTVKKSGVSLATMEEEAIDWWPVSDLPNFNCITNLRWLIPLALDKDSVTAIVYDPS
jgi:8-oxo-dGTP diphosphatase